jgi:DHA1 family multidrug resistance protein-like MFS transporter
MIIAGIVGLVGLIFLPETYAPVLLKRKATKLRFETKNWALHSKLYVTCHLVRAKTVI